MINRAHSIDELVVDISFSSVALARREKSRLAEWISGELLPALDEVFDSHAGGDNIFRFEKLEFDCGNLESGNYQRTIIESLIAQMKDSIEKNSVAIQFTNTNNSANTIREKQSDLKDVALQQLLFFLKTGQLPWNKNNSELLQKSANTLGITESSEVLLSNSNAAIHQQLLASVLQHSQLIFSLRAISERDTLVERLVRQFPIAQQQNLLRLLSPSQADDLLALIASIELAIDAKFLSTTDSRLLSKKLRRKAFELFLSESYAKSNFGVWSKYIFNVCVHHLGIAENRLLTALSFATTSWLGEQSNKGKIAKQLALLVKQSNIQEVVAQKSENHSNSNRSENHLSQVKLQESLKENSARYTPIKSDVYLKFIDSRNFSLLLNNSSNNCLFIPYIVKSRNAPWVTNKHNLHYQVAQAFIYGSLDSLISIWSLLINENRAVLVQAATHYLPQPEIRQSIVLSSSIATLRDIFSLVFPNLFSAVSRVWDAVCKFFNTETLITNKEIQLDHILWEITFNYIFSVKRKNVALDVLLENGINELVNKYHIDNVLIGRLAIQVNQLEELSIFNKVITNNSLLSETASNPSLSDEISHNFSEEQLSRSNHFVKFINVLKSGKIKIDDLSFSDNIYEKIIHAIILEDEYFSSNYRDELLNSIYTAGRDAAIKSKFYSQVVTALLAHTSLDLDAILANSQSGEKNTIQSVRESNFNALNNEIKLFNSPNDNQEKLLSGVGLQEDVIAIETMVQDLDVPSRARDKDLTAVLESNNSISKLQAKLLTDSGIYTSVNSHNSNTTEILPAASLSTNLSITDLGTTDLHAVDLRSMDLLSMDKHQVWELCSVLKREPERLPSFSSNELERLVHVFVEMNPGISSEYREYLLSSIQTFAGTVKHRHRFYQSILAAFLSESVLDLELITQTANEEIIPDYSQSNIFPQKIINNLGYAFSEDKLTVAATSIHEPQVLNTLITHTPSLPLNTSSLANLSKQPVPSFENIKLKSKENEPTLNEHDNEYYQDSEAAFTNANEAQELFINLLKLPELSAAELIKFQLSAEKVLSNANSENIQSWFNSSLSAAQIETLIRYFSEGVLHRLSTLAQPQAYAELDRLVNHTLKVLASLTSAHNIFAVRRCRWLFIFKYIFVDGKNCNQNELLYDFVNRIAAINDIPDINRLITHVQGSLTEDKEKPINLELNQKHNLLPSDNENSIVIPIVSIEHALIDDFSLNQKSESITKTNSEYIFDKHESPENYESSENYHILNNNERPEDKHKFESRGNDKATHGGESKYSETDQLFITLLHLPELTTANVTRFQQLAEIFIDRSSGSNIQNWMNTSFNVAQAERLIRYLSDSTLHRLITHAQPNAFAELNRIIKPVLDAFAMLVSNPNAISLRRCKWFFIFERLFLDPGHHNENVLIQMFAKKLSSEVSRVDEGKLLELSRRELQINSGKVISDSETLFLSLLRSSELSPSEQIKFSHLAENLLDASTKSDVPAWLNSTLSFTQAEHMARYLPSSTLHKLLLRAHPNKYVEVEGLVKLVLDALSLLSVSNRSIEVKQARWLFILEQLFLAPDAIDPDKLIPAFARKIAIASGISNVENLVMLVQQRMVLISGKSTQFGSDIDSQNSLTQNKMSSDTQTYNKKIVISRSEKIIEQSRANEAILTSALQEGIHIVNAGQVLAAPFLPRLFSMLKLTENEKFISMAAANRAAHLLQYMVTEATQTPEYDLLLNKVLCGISTSLPITAGIDISDNEKATIEQMLASMVQHWKILGNTSVAGLREIFLQRQGWLSLTDDGWHLQVHPGTFDMLLDQLPWSISIIKHGWMDRPLRVSWRN